MTLKQLDEHRERRKEYLELMEMLETLRGKATPGSPAYDGMPHGYDVTSKVEHIAIAIADLEAKLPVVKKILDEDRPIMEFIEEISDHQTRTIFRLRFDSAMTWAEVADAIGGGNTEAGVKQRCYRYLELSQDGWAE